MVSANTLCKSVLNVKNTVIENFNLYSDEDGVKHIRIKDRPKRLLKKESITLLNQPGE